MGDVTALLRKLRMFLRNHDITGRWGILALGVLVEPQSVWPHKEVHSLLRVSRCSLEWADSARMRGGPRRTLG